MLNNEANVAWNWRSNRHVAGPFISSFLSCNDAGKTHFLLILREFASSFAVDVLDEQSMSDSLSAFSSKRDYVVNSWYAIKNWSTTCAIIISDWRMRVECKTTSVVSGTSSFRQVFNFYTFQSTISSNMGEVLYKHNGVMFEHRTVQNMTDLTNSSSVTKTAAAAAASNETSGVLTMSSVSLLYQYFAFMSYFMGKRNTKSSLLPRFKKL